METPAQATEEALLEREITFAALAAVAPVGLMRFDANGRCNYVNARWQELAGLTIDEAIGDGWMNAIHPDDRKAILDRWARLPDRDDLFREEYRICRPDGVMLWVLAEGCALRNYSRETIGFIRTVTDITRHRELEAEASSARQDLERRVRERTADLEAEMVERQRLEREVLESKENEQRRFSRDLHDGLGQCLTGVLFHTLALERALQGQQSPLAANATKIAELVDQAVNQAHDLARGIYPVPLRPDGLISALQDLVQAINDSHPVECSLQSEKPVLLDDYDAAIHLYRIAQEAITNAIKHSQGSRITVRLHQTEDSLALVVSDDGVGWREAHPAKSGRGLDIIKHRARLIGAAVEVKAIPQRGTTVQCIVGKNVLAGFTR
ncbi:MAG: PAS domain S-box protein [Verrucomicrobiota bacterium]|nr:PAS domain S-box protein [Verrucomicrobiota bacterium]